ncbi:helix-turn-helix domain-containing protein [Sphaerisporangium sp. NPDC005288]|uniref:winged helix-turn-helix transcriptional regulator n=1 Tax=Sphaerisporangium sp. NPDC005288 TaxID=3155114 RepID=UPI0033B7F9B7
MSPPPAPEASVAEEAPPEAPAPEAPIAQAPAPEVLVAEGPMAGLTAPVTVDDHHGCPATAVLRRVGDKWSPVLLSLLARGGHGFNELDRSVEGLSRRMLIRTLRSLERDGLVSRTVHASVPPRTEYALTDLGRSLREHLDALGRWAVTHEAELAAARRRYAEHL